jgi:uncharacterized protein YndB with AHSA1/START domain
MAKAMSVERSRTINAAPDRVFELIEDLRAWEQWSPWEELDPDMNHTYTGAERGVGAVHEWSGNKQAGAGRMEIIQAEHPRRLDLALDFLKPFKSHNTTRFDLVERGDGAAATDVTEVTWSMRSPLTLMMRIAGIFMNMDKRIGADFEKGLDRLAQLAES